VPLNQYNIITVLFSYLIEACNILIVFISLPIMYVLTIDHVDFITGQLIFLAIWSTSNTVCLLSIAISVFKILLLVRFSEIFPLDPLLLGRKVLVLSIIVGFVPSTGISTYETLHGIGSMNLVSYFTGKEQSRTVYPLPFIIMTSLFFAITLVMLFATLVYTSYFIRMNSSLSSELVQQHQKLSISLRKLMLGLVLFLIPHAMTTNSMVGGHVGDLSCQILLTPLFVNLMFIFFIFDDCVWDFLKRLISQKLQSLTWRNGRKIFPI
jgi:hypothetical protein